MEDTVISSWSSLAAVFYELAGDGDLKMGITRLSYAVRQSHLLAAVLHAGELFVCFVLVLDFQLTPPV